MSNFPTFRTFGERAVLINWPPKIDMEINKEVLSYSNFIKRFFAEELLDVVPTYHSIAVYVSMSTEINQFLEKLKEAVLSFSEAQNHQPNIISIPVCYEEPFALDIAEVTKEKGLSIPQLIELHTSPLYKVYFLGFLPGFPYLGGLDSRLHVNRRREPRSHIERGSVGIGGGQTGIYPAASPGGWNIIGKTPLRLFDVKNEPPTEINSGDFIKFEPITATEFDLLRIETESGTFRWRKEAYND